MFNYARSDTHFLLYIYDNLRNELIDQSSSSVEQVDLVRTVMDRSKEETLQRYERPFYDNQSGTGPTGWYHLLCRTPALFNREQFAVFRAVHQWRDEIARQEDESVHFIMPKHVLYNLAREIPVDMPSLLGCSHPMSKSFLKRKEDLLGVIRNAKRNGATGPDMKGFMQTVETTHADGGTKTRRLEHSATASTDGMKETMPSLRRDRTRMPTQANQSRFWGSTIPNNTSVSEARVSVYYENLRLSLPMPPLTAEVFEGAIVVEAVASVPCQTNLGTPAGHLNVKDRQPTRDSVFIVKQDGRSQKRKAADLSDLSDPPEHVSPRPDCNTGGDDVLEDFDGVELLQDSEQWTRTYNEQKQDTNPARRRSKKERAIQKTRTADSQIYKEEKPFDYINAASVLHALNNVPKRTTGMSKSVDPYSKSMDAPKSMPRSRKEIAGKSFTFKG